MAKHMKQATNINTRLKNISEVPFSSLESDKQLFAEMLVHGADLAGPGKIWELSNKWSVLLSHEFT